MIVLAILLIIGNFILVFFKRKKIITEKKEAEKDENEEREENEGGEGFKESNQSWIETLKNLVVPTYIPKPEEIYMSEQDRLLYSDTNEYPNTRLDRNFFERNDTSRDREFFERGLRGPR